MNRQATNAIALMRLLPDSRENTILEIQFTKSCYAPSKQHVPLFFWGKLRKHRLDHIVYMLLLLLRRSGGIDRLGCS